MEASGLRAALRLTPTDSLTIDAAVLYNHLETEGVPIVEHGMGLTQNRPLSEGSDDEYSIFSLNIKWALGAATLTSNTSYFDREQETLAYIPALGGIANNLGMDSETFAQELRLASNHDGPLNWLVGGFYKDSEIADVRQVNILLGPDIIGPLFVESLVDSDNRQWALFGEVSYDLSERMTLTGGLRYYEEENDVATFVSLLPIPVMPVAQSLSVLTPRVSLSFAINDGATAYVNIAQGFRAGGVNSNPLSGPAIGSTYDEDSAWNYEAGIKGNSADRRFSYGASVFYIDYKDYQADIAPIIIGGGVVDNIGDAHSVGIEGELAFKPVEGLEIRAAGAWIEAELDENLLAPKGNRLPLVPEYSASLSGSYHCDLTDQWQGFASGEFSLVGGTYESIFNFFENGSYEMMNIRAGAVLNNFRFTVFVNNLFDEQVSYRNLGDFGPGSGFFTNPPRTVGLKLSVTY